MGRVRDMEKPSLFKLSLVNKELLPTSRKPLISFYLWFVAENIPRVAKNDYINETLNK